jgi:pimeloyl-ACP methyl ester carboxylesterase
MSDARNDRVIHERMVTTRSGPVAYLESEPTASAGSNSSELPVAVFVHGIGTSSALWRKGMQRLGDARRCIALDLPLHGRTPAEPDLEFSLNAMADVIRDFCDALGLKEFDLVANDTGGAIAQVLAVREKQRIRSFVLTNCDTQSNLPPKAFLPTVWMAKTGLLALGSRWVVRKDALARRAYAGTYENLRRVPAEQIRDWVQPVFGTRERARHFQRWVAGLNDKELVAIEPALRAFEAPTLILWGTGDKFFTLRWAKWLQQTIPGARDIVEVAGGRLFFPDERPDEFAAAVREFWTPVVAETATKLAS